MVYRYLQLFYSEIYGYSTRSPHGSAYAGLDGDRKRTNGNVQRYQGAIYNSDWLQASTLFTDNNVAHLDIKVYNVLSSINHATHQV